MADPPRLSRALDAQQRLAIGVADDGEHLDRALDFDASAGSRLGRLSDHLPVVLVRLWRLERQQRLDRAGLRRARPSQGQEGRRNGARSRALPRYRRCDRWGAGIDHGARLARDAARYHRASRRLCPRDLPHDAGLFRLLRLRNHPARHRRLHHAVLRIDRLRGACDRHHAALHPWSLRTTEAGRRQCGRRGIDRQRCGPPVAGLLFESSRSSVEIRSRDARAIC